MKPISSKEPDILLDRKLPVTLIKAIKRLGDLAKCSICDGSLQQYHTTYGRGSSKFPLFFREIFYPQVLFFKKIVYCTFFSY